MRPAIIQFQYIRKLADWQDFDEVRGLVALTLNSAKALFFLICVKKRTFINTLNVRLSILSMKIKAFPFAHDSLFQKAQQAKQSAASANALSSPEHD